MDIYRRRAVTAVKKQSEQSAGFNPFKAGTKQLKAGYKRLKGGIVEEVATGRQQQF
ncbi:hypothetical protein [Neptunicella sp. SCSIO 80796]|uniref:hypothetical protein n=1 Tax=Neptunicella plasticusilytica TaxID=3117012 RepID=UPI003A4DD20C